MPAPTQFKNVTAVTKANVYFDGNVVSHSILFPDGSRKTLGIIHPGQYHFGTDQAEHMEIVAGTCLVTLDGASTTPTPAPTDTLALTRTYTAGDQFNVPAKSGFTIAVTEGLCEYVCSFLG